MDKNEMYSWEVLNCDNATSVLEMESGSASSSVCVGFICAFAFAVVTLLI
jgi:hypothetical protein